MNEVPSAGSSDYVELYTDTAGEWHWRRLTRAGLTSHGEVVSKSDGGYAAKGDCAVAAWRTNPGVALRWQPPPEADEDDATRSA